MVMKTVWEARKQLVGIAAVFLLILLMMNLNSRLNEYFRLTSERDKIGTQVGSLSATKLALETRVAYATSDQAVEDWARKEAHMARPGDKVVIPITPAGQTAVPEVQVTPTPKVIENWEIWWALFFDD